MRTARALTVSPSMLCAGGGVSAPRGFAWSGGAWSRGFACYGGMLSQHALRQTPSPVNRITHACENITLPQLRCGRLLELSIQ